jgi:hypothetical protein
VAGECVKAIEQKSQLLAFVFSNLRLLNDAVQETAASIKEGASSGVG